jgi:hypothetical protein
MPPMPIGATVKLHSLPVGSPMSAGMLKSSATTCSRTSCALTGMSGKATSQHRAHWAMPCVASIYVCVCVWGGGGGGGGGIGEFHCNKQHMNRTQTQTWVRVRKLTSTSARNDAEMPQRYSTNCSESASVISYLPAAACRITARRHTSKHKSSLSEPLSCHRRSNSCQHIATGERSSQISVIPAAQASAATSACSALRMMGTAASACKRGGARGRVLIKHHNERSAALNTVHTPESQHSLCTCRRRLPMIGPGDASQGV